MSVFFHKSPSAGVDDLGNEVEDSYCYTDGNLDWSFLELSKVMQKVLTDDYVDMTKKRFPGKKKTFFTRTPSIDGRGSCSSVKLRKSSTTVRNVGFNLSPYYEEMHETLEDWSFNIFHLNEMTKGTAIPVITQEIFNRHRLLLKFGVEAGKFEDFVLRVGRHYKRIPFHNTCHATDVLQTVNCIILNTGFSAIMTELEIFCLLITSLLHDIEHTGTTNNFHKNSGSEMARLYVVSVLENHHLRVGLGMLWKYGLLEGLTKQEVEEFKSMMTSMILCTDMTNHFQLITNMKVLLELPARSELISTLCRSTSRIRVRRIMMLILHAADISNPAKPWDIHKIWVALLCEEFFKQGEKEKELNLPVSPNCDQNTANIATLQIGFIGTFLAETLEVMDNLIEKDINEYGAMYTLYNPWTVCMRDNLVNWRGQWRYLKYEFVNRLFEETADPRKSIAVKNNNPLLKKKKRAWLKSWLCCCRGQKELNMFHELSSTTV